MWGRVTGSTTRGVGGTLVILLAGGDKSTQARDIARAVGLAAQLKDPR
jgi:putative component of toxin-antitoxin plasmid stabilization module